MYAKTFCVPKINALVYPTAMIILQKTSRLKKPNLLPMVLMILLNQF